jgi:phytoene dehydrogenase-like protein
VQCDSPVGQILLGDGGEAVGVRLQGGREIRAHVAVLAACDARQTLAQLLPAGTLSADQERRVRAIPTSNLGYGQAKVDVALSGRLALTRHQHWRRDDLDLRQPSHTIGTEAGMERTFARSGAGLLPLTGEYSLWPVIPTALDPSQAPDGQDTLYLYAAVVPYRVSGGWATAKDDLARGVLGQAAEYYDGLEELELGRQVLTNEDIGHLTNATGGNVTHVDMTLARSGPLRPARGFAGYRTPVKGLFLSGAGTHPGGGITGAPGYVAARELLRTVRREGRRAGGRSRGASTLRRA